MAHHIPVPFPCPVKLGSIKGDSLEAELHDYVREGNYVKVKKLLKKGVFVDAVNSMGQTPLFTAALLGLSKVVDVLLDYGSDTNHRSYDGSTPVHAAAFSGNQGLLSKLLDAGGDLRAHDQYGRTPEHWALSASKESSALMLEFMQQCTLHMQAAMQNFPSDLLRKVGSSKALVCSPSRFGGLVQGNVDSALGRLLKREASVAKDIYSFGFGKLLLIALGYALSQFYLAGSGHLGYLASLPIIGEKDVVQADDEPAFSYHVGPFMVMTNLMWGSSRVTVKELALQPPEHGWKLRWADLLLAEQEHSSKLRHPQLLQLMAVCLSSDLERTRLVFERVHFGSLYSILHQRRAEFPVLHTETLLHLLLQVIDAVRFLHCRGFIHRSLSSHAIQVVSSGEAKLCNLEFMIESKDSGEHSDLTRIPVPVQLYRWCSPEVVLERAVTTVRADVYSFCAVLQEALTESPPWKGFEDSAIKQLISSGQHLEADVRLPMPYYDVVKAGLEPKQRNRSMKLQDIQYILKNDFKDLVKARSGHADDVSKAQRPAVFADVNICWASAFSYQKRTVEFQGKDPAKADGSAAPRDCVLPEEKSALVVQEAPGSVHPAAQDSPEVASEILTSPSESDRDESLQSFEMNEIFASYPEIHKEFLGEESGLDQTLQEAKRQQKEEDESPLEVLSVSSGAACEDEEEGDSSESGTLFTAEEEEEEEEEEVAQGRGNAGGRRGSSPSPNEQHISKCVLNIKIIQSMLQQAADSLCRTEENLDRLKAIGKRKKLLQEIKMSQISKQSFPEGHQNGAEDASQSASNPFSGVKTLLHKAVGPPSSDYIPPPTPCQAQGALSEDNFQAVPKTARETQAVQSEKRKSQIENNHHDSSASECQNAQCVLNHGLLDSFQHLLPHGSARCQNKLNLQCQRGADSHPAARSGEGRWCYSKPRSEFYSKKTSEERRMMQSEWRTEVKQMARRVASGQLELSSPCPASEGTSESEAESAKETFQHVTARAPKGQGQQRWRWQPPDDDDDDDGPWGPGGEDRTDSEESDLESSLSSSRGRIFQSPLQEGQAESGIAIHKDSVLPAQAEDLSGGRSRGLHCSLSSPPDVSEEFFSPDYFLPPGGSSEPEVKITAKLHNIFVLELHMSIRNLFSLLSTNPYRVSNVIFLLPFSIADAAREVMLWEPREECQEKDMSLADIQDLSSIPCEQESGPRDVECKTPRLSHAPSSVSTPLGTEGNIPLAFGKYKHCHELASDFSWCGSPEASSTTFHTFTTACEGERSLEIPGAASRLCPFEFKEPVIVSSLRNTRQALDFSPSISALSEASQPSIDELPPPAQELLDEIEHLKQQDSIPPAPKEVGLQDCRVQRTVPHQIRMESRESEKESERKEEANPSLWTQESFSVAEDTERAHSTLDDILERMLHAVPGDEEIQEQ
ncbi:TEX14 kinase, partial [Campylorhamphus procurvoides]|nr:TEX14 kinase [Campylorhamphus procurvoides]